MQQMTQQPLNDAQLDRLGDFLEGVGAPAMNLEMLDGFFAALICGPETVLPSEHLPQVFGEDHCFDSNDQAAEILGLVMRHWNTIASELFRTLEKDDVYLPVLLEDADGAVHGNDWARGFMRGIQLRPNSWQELIGSEEFGGPMLPIMILTHEHDPDPAMRPPEIAPDKRDELLQSLIAGLTHIYRYFASHRQLATQGPLRRQGPKIGRNDQCPCGSGRKYKHCCATSAPTVH
ncbi:YecA family protein (plasmid) [Xanthomonas citri pv. citri]|uniref:YecA/YgfB family protein n=1 Tax=Xanthomonas citri TaxID=346 RepID=UPI000EF2A76C|nr:YecA family protein [Xanthomonas citri]AYL27732.1 YecA family protein [Xanthomonas citri pv. citri]